MDLLSLRRSLWALPGFRYDGDSPGDSTNGSGPGGGLSGGDPGGDAPGGSYGGFLSDIGYIGPTQVAAPTIASPVDNPTYGYSPSTAGLNTPNVGRKGEAVISHANVGWNLFTKAFDLAISVGLPVVGVINKLQSKVSDKTFGEMVADALRTGAITQAEADSIGKNPAPQGDGGGQDSAINADLDKLVADTPGAATAPPTPSQTLDDLINAHFGESGAAGAPTGGAPTGGWQPNFSYGGTASTAPVTTGGTPAPAEGKFNQSIADYVNTLDWSAAGSAASAVTLRQQMAKFGVSAADVAASTGHPLANVNALLGIAPVTSGTYGGSYGASSGASGSSGGSYDASSGASGSSGGSYSRAGLMGPEDVSNNTWNDWYTKDRGVLESQATLAGQRGDASYDYLNGLARANNTDLDRMREEVYRYGSQAYQDSNAGKASAGVQQDSDSQYAQMQRQAYASGIDPSRLMAMTANQRAYNTALGKVQAAAQSRDLDMGRYTAGLGAVNTAASADRAQRASLLESANKLGMGGYSAGLDLSKLKGQMGTAANAAYTGTMNANSTATQASAAMTSAGAAATNASANVRNADTNW